MKGHLTLITEDEQITDPLGQILNYQYDASGKIISMSDGRHMRIDRIRDTDGNLTAANLQINIQEEPANSDTILTQYQYDNASKPILISTQE